MQDIESTVINLIPVPTPRPRVVTNFVNGKRVSRTYNSKKYTEYKKAFLQIAKMQNKRFLTGALKLEVLFVMPIPKSWSKKKREAMVGQPHICKPDIDNLLKSVLDELEGTIYRNDSQIFEIS
jgi:Holliday junction resolvase RusA-like endonuclease